MAIENLNNQHFTEEAKAAILGAYRIYHDLIAEYLRNISPEERQSKGSINEENKLVIHKAKDYNEAEPTKSSPDVDWVEYHADHSDRHFLEQLENMKKADLQGLANARILHDYDLYKAALLDYDYAKYKLGTGDAGYEQKVNEYKQFFTGGRPPADADDGTVTEETS